MLHRYLKSFTESMNEELEGFSSLFGGVNKTFSNHKNDKVIIIVVFNEMSCNWCKYDLTKLKFKLNLLLLCTASNRLKNFAKVSQNGLI